ncbi:MAG: hypothetical protein HC914_12730, partial [Chloroflexaceae bacterium]|nr:hypothetical protein [Chloroflexaceae bacterium]
MSRHRSLIRRRGNHLARTTNLGQRRRRTNWWQLHHKARIVQALARATAGTFANEPGRFAVSGLLVAHYASDAMTLSWRRLSANAIIEAESAAHAISVGQQLVCRQQVLSTRQRYGGI